MSNGKNSILVVVDRLNKYTHLLSLSHPYISKFDTEKFIDGVVKLHGTPKSIVSDNDLIFISHFWHEFFKMSGIKPNMSSSYHLGLTENLK